MSVLIATDLDRTLVYSRAALALTGTALPQLTCVERRGGEQVGFMTAAAARLTAALAEPGGAGAGDHPAARAAGQDAAARAADAGSRSPPTVACCWSTACADPSWQRRVAAAVAGSATLSDVMHYVRQHCDPAWTVQVREAGGLFCYAVLGDGRCAGRLRRRGRRLGRPRGWTVSAQGRKLYWTAARAHQDRGGRARWPTGSVPNWCWRRGIRCWTVTCCATPTGASTPRTVSCSPAAGPLPGWSCTEAAGVLAGQEIVEWFAARAGEFGRCSGGRRPRR